MPTRTITTVSRRFSRELLDTLMSLFALELAAPSRELYLVSGWATDVPLLDNSFGQYRALLPETSGKMVRLSALLNALADRGVKVSVATRHDPMNEEFIARLNRPPIIVRQIDDLHVKMLVTEHFCWDGSMNFTYNGVYNNQEIIHLWTSPETISQALLDVKRIFEEPRP
jgi:hypothetical protein